MAEIVNFPDPGKDRAEAEAWLARLDGDEFSAADAEALRKWLREKPEHKRAILEAMTLWNDLDILSDLREMFPLAAQRVQTQPAGLAGLFHRPLVMAAVAGFCLISGALLWNRLDLRRETPPIAAESVLRTTVGQQGRYDLADGSQVILNTDSLLEAEFTADRRDLRLVKGEAHFQVAHDPQRPFLVHAGAGVVRAVGTAFTVHLKGDEVEVNVTEGKVLVAASGAGQEGAATIIDEVALRTIATELKAGQSVEYSARAVAEVQTLKPELLARRLAWQSGMLMFQGETLAEVVAEISRYTNAEIIIADPDIRGIRIGGYFKTGEVDALLTVLEDSFAIRVNRLSPNLVYLNGAASTTP